MRKQIALILALLLLLTGCGATAEPEVSMSSTTATVPTTAAPETTEATEPTEPEITVLYLKETEISYKENGTVGYRYTYVYDDQGKELSHTNYTSGNDQTTLYENHYDDQGRLVNQTITQPDGTTRDTDPYFYNDDEGYREKSDASLAALGNVGSYITRDYLDEQGQVVKNEVYVNGMLSGTFEYDSEGRLLMRENNAQKNVYERDEQGTAVRLTVTNKQDGSETVTLYTNTYDEQDRLILAVTNEGGEDTQKIEYLYEDGRTTQTITYLKDITYFFMGQEELLHSAGDTTTYITDYDENGNEIRRESLENGQSDGYVEYTYIALELPGNP